MAPPDKNRNHLATDHLCFLLILSTAALCSVVVSATDSSLCSIPSPAPERVAAGGEGTLPLIHSFRLSAGYFSGGEDIHFARDETGGGGGLFHVRRSFTLLPLRVDRTTNATLIHVSATLTLSGNRPSRAVAAYRQRYRHRPGAHSVSFHLDGYYSSASAELCMVGSGTYTKEDGLLKHLPDAVLRLRVPSPPSLTDPFVTGELKGAGFDAITLVAYAEGDGYMYGQHASCPPPPPPLRPPSAARGAGAALQAPAGGSFPCARLRELLVSSYKLRHGGGGGAHASSSSASTPAAPLRLQEPRMHIGQVQCTAGGAVRLYATFSGDTNMWLTGHLRPGFMVKEAAVVAEGHWDSAVGTLCLRACRVVRSGPASLAVEEHDCGIGMSFWFPAVWTIHDRSIVAGTLWNSSGHGTAAAESNAAAAAAAAGAISVSSIDMDSNRGNFSDVEYRYTMVDEAKRRYFKDVLRSHKNKAKGPFPAAKYSYHDFEFRFYRDSTDGFTELGEAHPVTIGAAMVYGDKLAADASFSQHAEVAMKDDDKLLTVSYDMIIRDIPRNLNPMRPNLTSLVSIEERQMTAEGVYDPRTGVLCMIGCQELNGGSTTDCQVLITARFPSPDAKAAQQGFGKGVISSLRAKATDPLFFDKIDIVLFGVFAGQASEQISRMDMESVMLVVSTTLPCVFTALQILHAKRSPEASAATSVTMLLVMALGYVAPLVIGTEALFVSRGTEYAPFQRAVPHELRQAVLRVPTLVAFVLQLRLIQLTWSARRSAAGRSKQAATSAAAAAAEKRALWVCLPLYLLGGALTVVADVWNSRRAAREGSLAVRIGPEPGTVWEDLAASAGLALDGFLLPQVAMNAFSGGGAGAVSSLSPWFYAGGTASTTRSGGGGTRRAGRRRTCTRALGTTGSASRGTSSCRAGRRCWPCCCSCSSGLVRGGGHQGSMRWSLLNSSVSLVGSSLNGWRLLL